ncbi:sulfur carrier protein ThiS [Alteromonas halophila]|uniref:Sulfur carrier protein ThiS n=1 Tax=Alteromonas halophila TaxID=516698 RepID=A0A918MXD9_9ALTE|nr:sulfur carrier protein ThiS [Alteromonas halophila]GGW81146.1 hypothetical protein GCM10007391_12840 [Alteromonas halophila]
MQISVNNQTIEINEEMTVTALVKAQNLNTQAIAVAVNQHIIHRENWPEYHFSSGDKVDIVTVVAGG